MKGNQVDQIFYSVLLSAFLIICSCQEKESLYIATDFTPEDEFTSGIEGPASDKNGNVYAVNFEKQGTIGIVNQEGIASLFATLPEGSIGNGIRINRAGNLYVADYPKHNILLVNQASREVVVYAHLDEMNQPNDLAIAKNGMLYLSDPNWSETTGNLWRVDLEGNIELLESDMGTTNGIEISPDEKSLFVNESVQRNIWQYDLSPVGDISNKRLFHKFEDFGMDGMRCDAKGNLYVTRHGKGTVAILSPDGKLMREVMLKGKNTTNITFGGPEGKTCYVTVADRGCIETFKTEWEGREWSWN